MKTYRYLSLIALCAAAASCGNDWLDLEPSTRVPSETSIQLVSEAKYALNSVYNTMQDPYAYSGRLVYYADVTADDMIAVSSTKRTGNYYRFNFSRDNAPSTHWSYLYNMIANCNIVLSKIDALPTQNDDEKELRDNIKGEALCLKALAYFDLLRLYSYPYTMDNGASLGVPIVDKAADINNKPARATVAKVYEEIIADLTEGIGLIGEDFQKGHLNKWGALALLSRVYLYKGDNANAFKTAQEAISGAEGAKYALWTNDESPTAWANDANASNPGEVLFEIVNLTTDSPGKEALGYLSGTGYKDYCVTASFYNLMASDSKDVRNKIFKVSSKIAYVNKYQPQEGEVAQDANIPLIRLSEAYLNAAEAAVKNGDNANAVKYLDPIVKRANPANSVEGETITLERVLLERRKELVGEGHRLYDLMRNNLRVERVDETPSSKVTSIPKHYAKDLSFDRTFYKIVLPIPKAEMDANPSLQGQQNPGY
mgnify:CR=1 FL=1